MMRPRTKKQTGLKRDFGVHHSLLWKTMENPEDKTIMWKSRFWVQESVTCREDISTPQHPLRRSTFN